jgi:hypothetical protein
LVQERGEALEKREVTLVEVALEDVVEAVGGSSEGTLDAENGGVKARVELVEKRSEALEEGEVALLDVVDGGGGL